MKITATANRHISNTPPPHSDGYDFKHGIYATREEYSYQFVTRTDFNQALSQITAPKADHLTIAELPSSQEAWDLILQCGTHSHKLLYVYPNEDLFHVTSLYIDVANKRIYSLADTAAITTLANGYTHCMPAIDLYQGKRVLQDDGISCSYIAYQFAKKIENMLKAEQDFITINAADLPIAITADGFIFTKKEQDPEDKANYYLLPESFYTITQRKAPIVLNEAIVNLTANKELNSSLKPNQPALYKLDFEKYFTRYKNFDKSNKYQYVLTSISQNSYSQAYQQKMSAIKEPLIAKLNQLIAEQETPQQFLELAVKACMLTGAIPTEGFYTEFKLSQAEFVEKLVVLSSQNPQQIPQLIKDLQFNQHADIVKNIITQLATATDPAISAIIPQVAVELLANHDQQNLKLVNNLLIQHQLNNASICAIVNGLISRGLNPSSNTLQFISTVSAQLNRETALSLLKSKNQELCDLAFNQPALKKHILDLDIILQALVSENTWFATKIDKLIPNLKHMDSWTVIDQITFPATMHLNNFQKNLLAQIANTVWLKLLELDSASNGKIAIPKIILEKNLNKLLINAVRALPVAEKAVQQILACFPKYNLKVTNSTLTQMLVQNQLDGIDVAQLHDLILGLNSTEFVELINQVAKQNCPALFDSSCEIRQLSPNELADLAINLDQINNHEILKKISVLILNNYQQFVADDQQKILVGITGLVQSQDNSNALLAYKLLPLVIHELSAESFAKLLYSAYSNNLKYPVRAIQFIATEVTETQLLNFAELGNLKQVIELIAANSTNQQLSDSVKAMGLRLKMAEECYAKDGGVSKKNNARPSPSRSLNRGNYLC